MYKDFDAVQGPCISLLHSVDMLMISKVCAIDLFDGSTSERNGYHQSLVMARVELGYQAVGMLKAGFTQARVAEQW